MIWLHKSQPFCLGWCWLSTSKVAKSTQTTKHTTQHNNQNEQPLSSPPAALPLISVDRAAAPPTHGATAPYGSVDGAMHRVRSCRSPFTCSGLRNAAHQKIERDGPLALDGRCLIRGHNNQPKVSGSNGLEVGRMRNRGGTCGGQRLPVIYAIKLSDKK